MLANMNTNKLLLIGAGLLLLIAGFSIRPIASMVGGGDNTQFNASSVYLTSGSLTATATQILPSRTGRRYAMITNTSDTLMYLAFLSTSTLAGANFAPTTSYTVPVAANGGTFVINTDVLYTGAIYATGTAAKTYRVMSVY